MHPPRGLQQDSDIHQAQHAGSQFQWIFQTATQYHEPHR